MQLRTIRFELRLIGTARIRPMPESVFRPRTERCLIDELRSREVVEHWLSPALPARWAEPGSDHRRGVQRRFAAGSRRSMRAAITACNVRGTLTSARFDAE